MFFILIKIKYTNFLIEKIYFALFQLFNSNNKITKNQNNNFNIFLIDNLLLKLQKNIIYYNLLNFLFNTNNSKL